MSRTITQAFRTEKDKKANAPIYLYELEYGVGEVAWLYFAEYDTNITYAGHTYNKFDISHSDLGENIEGEIDVFRITIGNISREIQYYIENTDGMRGKQVKIKQVFANLLDDANSYIEDIYYIDAVAANEKIIEFTLTSKLDVFGIVLPSRRLTRGHCAWVFKSTECGYAGAGTTCDLSLARCRVLENTERYGAFPGIPGYRILRI